MKKSNCFLLLYGSETGQAQAIAEQIAEKSAEFGLQARLHCLDETGKGVEFNIEDETCMVMVTSTTGDGDAPDNASKFLRRIKKRTLASDYLSSLHYTILGLGDTNYNNFCKCARDMDSRLEQLGAKRFYTTGLADDGVGLELVADPWLEGLYPALKEFLGLSNNHLTEAFLSEQVSALNFSENKELESNINNLNSGGKPSAPVIGDIKKKIDSVDSVNQDKIYSSELNRTNGEDGVKYDFSNLSSGVHENSKDECDKGDISSRIDFVDRSKEKETQCVRVDVSNDSSVRTWRLHDNCLSLEDNDLTIPVMPPEFLQANYSETIFETESLSFQNDCKLPSSSSDKIYAQVNSTRVLNQPGALKKTLLLKLNIKDDEIKYSPGDSISVICVNNGSEIQLLLERLKVTVLADQSMSLGLIPNTKKRRAALPPHIHPTTTLRHLFKTCVSIRDPPSKAFLRALIEYTSSEREVRRLQELCSKQGAEEYTKCIREKCVSLLDLLYAFPSCQPPVERVIEFLPRLLPRPYSICSCPEASPNCLEIVFNVVDIPGDASDGHYYHRRGVCTGWLDDTSAVLQTPGHVDVSVDVIIPIFFRSNQYFQPPSDLSRPLILIGPGTGVAPFIGFLQQRALVRSKGEQEDKYGETWLFSGYRNKDKDYIFCEELKEFVASGTLSRLCVCFSRDPNSQYRYVQDYMKSESASLARLVVEEEALVYVCGDAKNMAKNVNATFQEILMSEKGFSTDQAHAFIMKKRLHKSYLEDVWT